MPTKKSGFPTREFGVEYAGRVGLREHWAAHSHEFPEYRNAKEYCAGAIDFCTASDTRRFFYHHEDRDTIGYFNRETGTYAATSVNGEVLYTYFRPGPEGIDAELHRWRMPQNAKGKRKMPDGVLPRHATPLRRV